MMASKVKEIFISTERQETRVAVTEDKRLEEYYVERGSESRMVGSIYKGRITSVVPGIGAAFVDIGLGKNGFLYVADIVEPKPDEDAILEGEPSGERLPAPPMLRSASQSEAERLGQAGGTASGGGPRRSAGATRRTNAGRRPPP
jgi:ribonuclease G